MAKSKRGRPSLFNYNKKSPTVFEKNVVALLKSNGVKYTRLHLLNVGVRVTASGKKVQKSVSLPTLRKLAEVHKILFVLGRPANGSRVAKLAEKFAA